MHLSKAVYYLRELKIISLFISTILFLDYLWFAVRRPSEVPGDARGGSLLAVRVSVCQK